MYSPIVELIVIFKYGIPVFSWQNKNNMEMASKAGENNESSSMIGGLLSAILSFSESISTDNAQALQQIKMANCTYQYYLRDDLIFFLGYDTNTSVIYEKIIDSYLFESVEIFDKYYSQFYGNDMELCSQDFLSYVHHLEESMKDDRWIIERTQFEILLEIKELLLDILGPVSIEIYSNNLRTLKYKSRGKDIDLNLFSENMVGEISMLMDPAQAEQIGQEIKSIIE